MNKSEAIIYALKRSEIMKEDKKQELIDYITNLQNENKRLKKRIKYLEMIISYNNEIKQPQDECEIYNELCK